MGDDYSEIIFNETFFFLEFNYIYNFTFFVKNIFNFFDYFAQNELPFWIHFQRKEILIKKKRKALNRFGMFCVDDEVQREKKTSTTIPSMENISTNSKSPPTIIDSIMCLSPQRRTTKDSRPGYRCTRWMGMRQLRER